MLAKENLYDRRELNENGKGMIAVWIILAALFVWFVLQMIGD